jgi:hypothetical protein
MHAAELGALEPMARVLGIDPDQGFNAALLLERLGEPPAEIGDESAALNERKR